MPELWREEPNADAACVCAGNSIISENGDECIACGENTSPNDAKAVCAIPTGIIPTMESVECPVGYFAVTHPSSDLWNRKVSKVANRAQSNLPKQDGPRLLQICMTIDMLLVTTPIGEAIHGTKKGRYSCSEDTLLKMFFRYVACSCHGPVFTNFKLFRRLRKHRRLAWCSVGYNDNVYYYQKNVGAAGWARNVRTLAGFANNNNVYYLSVNLTKKCAENAQNTWVRPPVLHSHQRETLVLTFSKTRFLVIYTRSPTNHSTTCLTSTSLNVPFNGDISGWDTSDI